MGFGPWINIIIDGMPYSMLNGMGDWEANLIMEETSSINITTLPKGRTTSIPERHLSNQIDIKGPSQKHAPRYTFTPTITQPNFSKNAKSDLRFLFLTLSSIIA